MKILLFTIILQSFFPSNTSEDLVKINYKGEPIWVTQVVYGPINLFVHEGPEMEEAFFKGSEVYSIPKEPQKQYFLGVIQQTIRINKYNYKRLIRKYLPNAPDLHANLGKHGFRFKNIEEMVKFYNDFRT